MEETCTCCICDSEVDKSKIKHITVKGKVKDICKECITSIKGLL